MNSSQYRPGFKHALIVGIVFTVLAFHYLPDWLDKWILGISVLFAPAVLFWRNKLTHHNHRAVAGLIAGILSISGFYWVGLKIASTPPVTAQVEATPAEQNLPQPVLTQEQQEEVWIERTKEGVRSRLKDSSSAKFENVYFNSVDGTPIVCGKVNSKNSYGGYTGFQRFIASGETLVFFEREVADFKAAWNKMCVH